MSTGEINFSAGILYYIISLDNFRRGDHVKDGCLEKEQPFSRDGVSKIDMDGRSHHDFSFESELVCPCKTRIICKALSII